MAINHPRWSIFSHFDQVIFMCGGRVAYTGPQKELVPYFTGLGFQCPRNENPADYYLHLLTPGAPVAVPEVIIDHWAAHEAAAVAAQGEASVLPPISYPEAL